jgi:hypothetical protein
MSSHSTPDSPSLSRALSLSILPVFNSASLRLLRPSCHHATMPLPDNFLSQTNTAFHSTFLAAQLQCKPTVFPETRTHCSYTPPPTHPASTTTSKLILTIFNLSSPDHSRSSSQHQALPNNLPSRKHVHIISRYTYSLSPLSSLPPVFLCPRPATNLFHIL